MIKTLIVDDSPLVRTIIRDFLESDGSFRILAEAENGLEAIKLSGQYVFDLITMDIEMPVMNGLDATAAIVKDSNAVIVVISTHDTAKMAYDATVKGANEFFPKDIFTSTMPGGKRNEILNTLKQLVQNKNKSGVIQKTGQSDPVEFRRVNCVVIGASTGGPKALSELCPELPGDFPVPVILVQHNASGFDKSFAKWLQEYCQLKVCLAEQMIVPERGNLYVAPTDKHLLTGNMGFVLNDDDPVNNQKPAVDKLFQSAAVRYGKSLVSVILTGMGNDGAEGTRAVREAGGITIAQDEASSMIYGMPQAAVETGCVNIVLPLDGIAGKLKSLVTGKRQL
jgi:two-component system chemotaxis response regulator CheB